MSEYAKIAIRNICVWIHRYRYRLVILLLCVSVYVPTINYPLLWDDNTLIQSNPRLTNIHNIGKVFGRSYLEDISDDTAQVPYYRPINMAALYLEKYLFGDTILGYRLIQYTLHILCVFLLYHFFLTHFKNKTGTRLSTNKNDFCVFIAILFFCTTPYSFDAVVFLSNAGDVLVLLFSLLTIFFFEKCHTTLSPLHIIGFATTLFLGVYTKETGSLIILVLIVIQYLNRRPVFTRIFIIPFFIALFTITSYWFIRANVLSKSISLHLIDGFEYFPTNFFVAVKWAVLPHPLALMESCSNAQWGRYLWVPLIFLAFGLILLTVKRKKIALPFWILTLFLSPIVFALPTVQIFAPRYLYIPSIGLALLLGHLCQKTNVKARPLLLVFPILLTLLTTIRIDAWKNDSSLWQLELERHPDSPLALIHFGRSVKRKNPQAAFHIFIKASKLAEKKFLPQIQSLALREAARILLYIEKNPGEAKKLIDQSIRLSSSSIAWLLRGDIYSVYEKNYRTALDAYLIADKIKQNRLETLLAIAGAYAGLKNFRMAYYYIEKANTYYSADIQHNRKIEELKKKIQLYENQLKNHKHGR